MRSVVLEAFVNVSNDGKDLWMLVLKRKEGQWVEVTHESGDVLRFRVYHICGGAQGRVCLAFQDQAHHFDIQRPERPCHHREDPDDLDHI